MACDVVINQPWQEVVDPDRRGAEADEVTLGRVPSLMTGRPLRLRSFFRLASLVLLLRDDTRQRRLTGVDEMVLSLSARGLTHGDISAHLAEVYGASVSKQTISTTVVVWRTS